MIRLKDYYKILKVAPTASSDEIKKSFRKMALELHPDKTHGDKYKEALFREIQEAYETLSDPRSRDEYNHKRWATRNFGRSYAEEALTPDAILAETKKLAAYVNSMNAFQLDHDALSYHLRQILSERNIAILHQFNQQSANNQIVDTMLGILNLLPYRYIEPICLLLSRLSVNDNEKIGQIHQYAGFRKTRNYWDRYKGLIALLITVIICLLMYWYASS
jgi:molecular chaperone DnaJ